MIPVRALSALVMGCLFLVQAEASLSFDAVPEQLKGISHHRMMNRRSADEFTSSFSRRAKNRKRCKARSESSSSSGSSNTTNNSNSNNDNSNNNSNAEATTTTSSKKSEATSSSNTGKISNANAVTGLINVQSQCGDIGATKDITSTTGPNGNLWWLNCGVEGGGWNPPYVQVTDLIAVDLGTALQDPNSPFQACSAYVSQFYQYGGEFNVPPILLASFAMQESTCNPATVGGGGEQGLMQLTWDKCGDAPGGNCKDPDYNIRTGAKYFAQTLASNNGNVLQTIGQYNGWPLGMTIASATAAASSSCCRCQNNIDYVFQMVNGWMQNVNVYSSNPPIGHYFNLNVCN